MQITEVKVFPIQEEKLKAFVSIVFDQCFMVNDIKIIQGKDGLFISMPSRKKKNGEFKDTLRIAKALLDDEHDLIHKACGWMLREVGKKDEAVLRKFLNKHKQDMPRTMLRYAIERFDKTTRDAYLGRV